MSASAERASPAAAWQSAALVSSAAGLYVSAFFIAGNVTMLTPGSMLLVAAILTLPIVAVVLASQALFALAGLRRYAGFASAFLVGLYLLLLLRAPIFSSPAVSAFREQLDGAAWIVAHLAWFLVPAAIVGFIFRKHLGKLAVILAVMTLAAVVPTVLQDGFDETQSSVAQFEGEPLDRRPNIHLILADSLSSFAYLENADIDVAAFRSRLEERGFRVYQDTFSNYHSTTDSMLSMLEMQHHYYQASRKQAEVSQSARKVIGGENSLVRFLKANGYRTEYIHHGPYLLFQGCTADYCYPGDFETRYFAGAKSVLREIVPGVISSRIRRTDEESPPIDALQREVTNRLEHNANESTPLFQYIHVYLPGHASNSVVGRCDERVELAKYAANVADTIPALDAMIDGIIRRDPAAVILLSGDHGPFIANRCERYIDIGTPEAYRDRVGVMTAVRWPDGYDGRFDPRIRTNVNLFRYVLASLVDDRREALGGRVRDDAFVHGSGRLLKILDDGQILVPATEFPSPSPDPGT
jgi:hypothetical protein